jgi:hypothetical protein
VRSPHYVVPGQVQKAAQYIGNMKKLLPLLFLGLSLASCSKGGDDPSPTPAPSILGKWTLVRGQYHVVYADGSGIPVTNHLFTASYIREYTADGTYRLLDKSTNVSIYGDYRYKVIGDSLTCTDPGGPRYSIIQKLTSDSLITTYREPALSVFGSPGTYYAKDIYCRWKQ